MVWRRGDATWNGRFVRGDTDVIEEVYRVTFREVRRAAGSVIHEPADRDAVVHETFLELLSNRELRESYEGGDLAAWVGAIVRHRAIDFVRREGRLTDLTQATVAAVASDPLAELRHELRRFAARLDPRQRQVLELRYVVGMTQIEAANALGMPRSTLEDWERIIKRMLKEFLAPSANDRGGPEEAAS